MPLRLIMMLTGRPKASLNNKISLDESSAHIIYLYIIACSICKEDSSSYSYSYMLERAGFYRNFIVSCTEFNAVLRLLTYSPSISSTCTKGQLLDNKFSFVNVLWKVRDNLTSINAMKKNQYLYNSTTSKRL